MIKRLRIVFITVTMFLVTVMVASIFLIVLQTTYSHMSERNLAILQKLDQESFRAPWPDFPEPLPQNCFILTVGVDGSVKVTSGYNNIPDEVIRRLILDKARSSQRRSGFFYDYGLMYYQLNDPENVSYAFLDISDEISTMQTLVINCLIIGLGTLVLCLPVCWLLARAITQPVAYSQIGRAHV